MPRPTPMAGARYAVYYAPPPDSPWWRFGCHWLGYDALTGGTLPPPTLTSLTSERWAALTARPRPYGFHATLQAPFVPAAGWDEKRLSADVARLASGRMPFALPTLAVQPLAGFLALRPESPVPAANALADDLVRALAPCRRLAPPEERRRRASGLARHERALLERWGYPYVMEAFRFHFTLTGPLHEAEHAPVAAMLAEQIAPFRKTPPVVDAVCLFGQPDRSAPFRLLARLGFDGTVRTYGTLADAP